MQEDVQEGAVQEDVEVDGEDGEDERYVIRVPIVISTQAVVKQK